MKPKRITRTHMATIYALILKGKLTPDEAQQFCVVLNRLIMAYWSYAGLVWIKEQAWKLHTMETGQAEDTMSSRTPQAVKLVQFGRAETPNLGEATT